MMMVILMMMVIGDVDDDGLTTAGRLFIITVFPRSFLRSSTHSSKINSRSNTKY